MSEPNKTFEEGLKRKREGGVTLEVFVSDGVWIGGHQESRAHETFVAIAPAGWDDEEEVTYFKDRGAVEAFIARLRATSEKAFGSDSRNDAES